METTVHVNQRRCLYGFVSGIILFLCVFRLWAHRNMIKFLVFSSIARLLFQTFFLQFWFSSWKKKVIKRRKSHQKRQNMTIPIFNYWLSLLKIHFHHLEHLCLPSSVCFLLRRWRFRLFRYNVVNLLVSSSFYYLACVQRWSLEWSLFSQYTYRLELEFQFRQHTDDRKW